MYWAVSSATPVDVLLSRFSIFFRYFCFCRSVFPSAYSTALLTRQSATSNAYFCKSGPYILLLHLRSCADFAPSPQDDEIIVLMQLPGQDDLYLVSRPTFSSRR